MLGGFIHAGHCGVDLLDSSRLLFTGGGNLADNVTHFFNPIDDFFQRFTGFIHQLRTGIHLVYTVLNQILDFFRRSRTAPGQITHLGSHHRKTSTLFAGARRFDAGVERQQIGLKGDFIDDANNFGNLFTRRIDFFHRMNGVINDLPPFFRHHARVFRQGIRQLRIVRILFHRAGDFFHAGRRFFQRGGLVFGA